MHKTQTTIKSGTLHRSPSQWVTLGLFIIVILLLSYLSSFPMMNAETMRWYDGLTKSVVNPPPWTFGVVWPALYVMMAVAAWRIWHTRGTQSGRIALFWFALQLGINLLWTIMFFELNSPLLGLVWLFLVLVAAYVTYRQFTLVDRIAGWLFIPYLLWMVFAAYLNATILMLN